MSRVNSQKKNAAIVFGITKNYVFALANVLIGMKKHCSFFWDDIIVYHDGISKDDQVMLSSIIKCVFIEFDIDDKYKSRFDSYVVDVYSLLVLSRFYCFDLLKKYKKIIWHDVDILVQNDFSGLAKYGEDSGFAATITDCGFYVESNFNKLVDGYSMYTPLYNAGVMVFSDRLSGYDKFTDWCFEKAFELADSLRYMDQGVLNLLIQEFKINVENIDILKYCCHPSRKECKSASIIHAYGYDKFWNSSALSSRFPEWKYNELEWLNVRRNSDILLSKKEKVSVVMSVYDRPDFLRESIESILNQTYSNIEIVIVVEYSEKQKEINDIIRNIKSQKIKIINNKIRVGFAESLNIAIKNSNGKFIARMDDDDISLPDRLEKQVEFMDSNPDIGICGTYIQCFGECNDKWTSVPTDPDICGIQLLFCTSLYHPTVVMRRDVIEKNNLYYDPNYFTEDYELWSRAVECTKIANIPEVLLQYRTSGQNITSNNPYKVHESHIRVMKCQFLKYLGLELTYDELQLVNKRIIIPDNVFNRSAALLMRDMVYKKIIKSNNNSNFYNKKLLNDYLGVNTRKAFDILNMPGYLVRLFIAPFYSFIKNKIYWSIRHNIQPIEDRLNRIESKIK